MSRSSRWDWWMSAAILLVSELFGNSVRYSSSGGPGETVTVVVRIGGGIVRLEAADLSGPGCRCCACPR